MIAFHHESQRLAVGTVTGAIAIYDVRIQPDYFGQFEPLKDREFWKDTRLQFSQLNLTQEEITWVPTRVRSLHFASGR